jgi:hypothetical protein
MASILPSGIITDIRGSLGNAVFSKAHSGHTLREYVKPFDAKTDQQVRQRTLFKRVSSGFSALTAAQVAGWNQLAAGISRPNKFGKMKPLTGFEYYMELCALRLTCGLALPTDPVPLVQYPAITITITDDVGTNTMNLTASRALADTEYIILKCSPYYPSGRTRVNKNNVSTFKVLGSTDTLPYNIWPDIKHHNGNLTVPFFPWMLKWAIIFGHGDTGDWRDTWYYSEQMAGFN